MTEILLDGPPDARRGVILAHGAGAPMDSTFMAALPKESVRPVSVSRGSNSRT